MYRLSISSLSEDDMSQCLHERGEGQREREFVTVKLKLYPYQPLFFDFGENPRFNQGTPETYMTV